MTGVGSCFGFDVRSDRPRRYLRAGGGALPSLTIEEGDVVPSGLGPPLLEWRPRPERRFAARLHRAPGGYRYWTDAEGWFAIEPAAGRIVVPARAHPVRRDQRLWQVPAVVSFLARGDLSLHAAAVEIDGAAVLLCAPGRHGKTTLAAAFHGAGHRMLAEDLACCRAEPAPMVFPGPALLRLRHDVASFLPLEDVARVLADEERVHLEIASPRRGDGAAVPVGSVVFLRAGGDEVRLTPRDPMDAVKDLWALSLRLPTDADHARCFSGVATIGTAVPAFDLQRPLTPDGLQRAVDAIVASHLTAPA